MSPKAKVVHSGIAYLICNEILIKIEKYIIQNCSIVSPIEETILKERLIQKIASLTVEGMVKNCSDEFNETGVVKLTNAKVDIKNITVNSINGEIILKKKAIFQGIVEFFYEWTGAMLAIMSGIRLKKSACHSGTIVLGIPGEALLLKENFIKYCSEGPVRPLKGKNCIFVRDSNHNTKIRNFYFSNRPIAQLVQSLNLSPLRRVFLFLKLLKEPFSFFFLIYKYPLISLLGRDFGLLETVRYLGSKNAIDSVIITNTNHADQYLWMRESKLLNFSTHKVHYSQNSRTLVYLGDKLSVPHPILRFVKVDEHWVWTKEYGNYLEELGHQGIINVVGPIMFYLPEVALDLGKEVFNVCIFDVTPVPSDIAKNMGILNNYYSPENLLQFLSILIEVKEQLEDEFKIKIKFFLKHKRSFNKNHDKTYIDFCQSECEKRSISLIDYNANIFSLIKGCHACISIPFTSPAYIATYLKIPSLYFDPAGMLDFMIEKNENIQMANSRDSLKRWIISSLKI